MSSFEKAIHDHAEKALLKMIGEGQFIMPDYRNRVPIPESFMRDVWNMLDLNVIKAKGLELAQLTDKLRNHQDTDKRWVSIGVTDLQTGLMALTRSVARPTTFA